MNIAYLTELGTLYHTDISNYKNIIGENSIDLIFTDPPYPKKYLPCYLELSRLANYGLKVGGSLVTILPHYNMPTTIEMFSDLKWRWLLHMNQWDGSHPRMSMGIEVTFKPMGWWVKEKFPKERYRGFIRDGIKIEGKAGQKKELHKWEQDLDWCEYYISKLTEEGQLVVDPFIGSGTLAVCCEKLNRRWIGFDADLNAIETTIERLKNAN